MMVSRKPVGSAVNTSNVAQPSTSTTNPPYPVTPTSEKPRPTVDPNDVYPSGLSTGSGFDIIDMREAQQRTRSDSDASSHGTWDSEDDDEQEEDTQLSDIPKPLAIRSSPHSVAEKKEELPAILRPGPINPSIPGKPLNAPPFGEDNHGNPWAELSKPQRSQTSTPSSTNNPYLSRHNSGVEGSQLMWQDSVPTRPSIPSTAPPPPPPPPTYAAPTAPVGTQSGEVASPPSLEHRPASWETAEKLTVPQRGQFPLAPVVDDAETSQPSLRRPASRWWESDIPSQKGESSESALSPTTAIAEEDSSQFAPPPGHPPGHISPLIDHVSQSTTPAPPQPTSITTSHSGTIPSPVAVPETPQTALRRQRNEHYQIKHVNWYDNSSTSDPKTRPGMRHSPILTQNANGPCPLLALVNALVLSTPRDLDTALLETLRTREQVSLGLLLDAVFDELMSGRRGDPAHALPDVSELYSFLLALHTGMNVNPRFVTPASTPRGSFDGHSSDAEKVHPVHRAQRKAGAFEETREMRLYSTFHIPLIHGWTPPVDTPAYEAFLRSAQTFEDAQNIQFAEPELNHKLAAEGLSPQKQQTLQDIHTIKAFLDSWPTQLTDYGLSTIANCLEPGQIAILFRNDHFSTIYKEPRHGALMTLVTDAGYGSHDEIIWESLVDVNGSASELFSGDFRLVSHDQDGRLNQGNSGGGNDGWETVPSRHRRNNSHPAAVDGSTVDPTPPPLPGPRPTSSAQLSTHAEEEDLGIPAHSEAQKRTAEQEDHDLALALQLQEEEEDRQRQDEERRRREQELSERFLSNEAETPRPPIPPRRRNRRSTNSGSITVTTPTSSNRPTPNSRTTPNSRPPVSRPQNSSDPDAPPSYEQAASDRPYRPAGSTAPASLTQGNTLGAYDALRRQQSAFSQQSSTTLDATPPDYGSHRRSDANRGRRRSSQLGHLPATGSPQVPGAYGYPTDDLSSPQRVPQAAGVRDAEGRCTIM